MLLCFKHLLSSRTNGLVGTWLTTRTGLASVITSLTHLCVRVIQHAYQV